tara:strand:+ start:275 stop:550 length:276 start_codon:yes stop_codon:yes gene_type:complete
MTSNNSFLKLDQAIRKYIRSEKVQRELFEDIATKFLKAQVETRSGFSVDGRAVGGWDTLEGTNTRFSNVLIDSVIAVIADEFKQSPSEKKT